MATLFRFAVILCWLWLLVGCQRAGGDLPAAPGNASGWAGIPTAVNQVIVWLHEGTGWVLNKSQVSVAKESDVRPLADDNSVLVANFKISVSNNGNQFETTATDVPCDKDGIPTEAAVEKLRAAVEDIKAKIKRLQN